MLTNTRNDVFGIYLSSSDTVQYFRKLSQPSKAHKTTWKGNPEACVCRLRSRPPVRQPWLHFHLPISQTVIHVFSFLLVPSPFGTVCCWPSSQLSSAAINLRLFQCCFWLPCFRNKLSSATLSAPEIGHQFLLRRNSWWGLVQSHIWSQIFSGSPKCIIFPLI